MARDQELPEGTPIRRTLYAKSIHYENEECSTSVDYDWCVISDEVVEEPFAMILSARRAKGQYEIDGALRVANIVRLIVADYKNLRVAQEMQMTYYNVRNYRRQIRITLQTLVRAGEESRPKQATRFSWR